MLQSLYTFVASVCSKYFICLSDVCCKCVYLDVTYVLHILQVFYLHAVYIYGFSGVFESVSSISSVFFCMLLVLYLNVLEVDCVLHMRCVWKAGRGDVRAAQAQRGRAKWGAETDCHRRPSRRYGH